MYAFHVKPADSIRSTMFGAGIEQHDAPELQGLLVGEHPEATPKVEAPVSVR